MQLTRIASLIACPGLTDAVGSLARGHGGAGRQPVEIPAHQLRGPTLGNIAGERHGAGFVIDRQNGPHDVMIRPLGIENAQRKQQAGARQASCFLVAQIKFVKVERRLAVELEQHVAA